MDKLFRVPSLQALQAFVEVAATSHFTQAAERLCLTQSAISRQVQQLEAHYGVPLLVRSSRRVALTAEGQEVLAVAQRMMGELQALEKRLAPRDSAFRIRIHVSLAVRWLLPRLTDFYARHPDLTLSIETVATQRVDPSGECDACILYLPAPPDDQAHQVLFEEFLVPVCAPLSVNGKAPPAALDELNQYPLIHGSTGQLEWASWLQAQHLTLARDSKHITFNLDELALEAAARGMGIAMTDQTLAQELINRGELIVPFGPPLKTGGAYTLWLQPSSALHPARPAILEWFARHSEPSI